MGEVIKAKAGELIILKTWTERYGANRKFTRMCKILCFCGNKFKSLYQAVQRSQKNSCGCVNFKSGNKYSYKHGYAPGKQKHSSTYRAWVSARTRCSNPNDPKYHIYGGKGIKVCDEWLEFETFLKDMGEKPAGHRFLSRIDKDGDYEPDNCEWVPIKRKKK